MSSTILCYACRRKSLNSRNWLILNNSRSYPSYISLAVFKAIKRVKCKITQWWAYVNSEMIDLTTHIRLLIYDDGLEVYISLFNFFYNRKSEFVYLWQRFFFVLKVTPKIYVVIRIRFNAILKWKVSQSLSSTYKHSFGWLFNILNWFFVYAWN